MSPFISMHAYPYTVYIQSLDVSFSLLKAKLDLIDHNSYTADSCILMFSRP